MYYCITHSSALGLAISKTTGTASSSSGRNLSHPFPSDFEALETLLNLFATLLPPASRSKDRRNAYIRDVFPERVVEVTGLLDKATDEDWEATAMKVVDILAASEIGLYVRRRCGFK